MADQVKLRSFLTRHFHKTHQFDNVFGLLIGPINAVFRDIRADVTTQRRRNNIEVLSLKVAHLLDPGTRPLWKTMVK
jgi:hypothetical protein